MTNYAIVMTTDWEEKDREQDKFYLNHAYLSSLTFGSEDMAWTTDDKMTADLMCYKCQNEAKRYGAYTEFNVEELY